jgi:hypothetical protein
MNNIKQIAASILILTFVLSGVVSLASNPNEFTKVAPIQFTKKSYIQKIQLKSEDKYSDYVIYDATNNKYVETQETVYSDPQYQPIARITSVTNTIEQGYMNDNSSSTYTDLLANKSNTSSTLIIEPKYNRNINGLEIVFDNISNKFDNLILKNTNNQSIIASGNSNKIDFAQINPVRMELTIIHSQNIRINEIKLIEVSPEPSGEYISFLAYPDTEYSFYSSLPTNDSRSINNYTIYSDAIEVEGQLGNKTNNPIFAEKDTDKDGIPDGKDNCVEVANKDQKDLDKNSRGDDCEDKDGDGVYDGIDNCPFAPNSDQADIDNDKKGDVCDKTDNRYLANNQWILWVGIGVTILGFLGSTIFLLNKKDIKSP